MDRIAGAPSPARSPAAGLARGFRGSAPRVPLAVLLVLLFAPGIRTQVPGPEEDPAGIAAALRTSAGALQEAADAVAAGRYEAVRPALQAADAAFQRAQALQGIGPSLRERIVVFKPLGPAPLSGLQEAARALAGAASALQAVAESGQQRRGADQVVTRAQTEAVAAVEEAHRSDAIITQPFQVLAILLAILALLFACSRHPRCGVLFKFVPLLLFCYFVPTLVSNLGIIPVQSPIYDIIKRLFLPMSLVLLVLAVDLKAILRLGRNAVTLFLAGTVGIVIGGPLAYLLCSWFIPVDLGPSVWKGLAALSGSWIGGGANMIAIKESVGLPDGGIFPLIIVVDVLVANIWMAVLLFFAGRERRMDAAIHADRTTLDDVRQRVEAYEAEVARPTTLADLLIITAIGVGTTALSWALAESGWLPTFAVVSPFTWVVVIATTVALILSFTRLRGLEGAGASKVGSVFLYLLVASIGAHAEFSKVGDAPALLAVGAVWMAIHASIMLLVRWKLRAPIFFMAVGSKANVGGAASAPVVAAAFHPALAPVGVLLAILGYVLGTYAGLLCALLLEGVYGLVG